MLAQVRKALVPLGVAAVLYVLGNVLGVVQTTELIDQVTLVVTAVLVYLIPNN